MKAFLLRWSILTVLFAGQYAAIQATAPDLSQPDPVKLGPAAQQWLGEVVRA